MNSKPFDETNPPVQPIPIKRFENGPPPKRANQSKYDESVHCDQLAVDMANGLSFQACCGSIGITVKTGAEWCKKHKEFAEAREIGEAAGQYFWEKKGIDNLTLYNNVKFNGTVWVFTMKNRFGWRDKREISGSLDMNGGTVADQFKHMTAGQLEDQMRDLVGRLPAHLAKLAPERLSQPAAKPPQAPKAKK